MPWALGASTQRAVKREECSLDARSMLAGCSAMEPKHEASVPGEHAASTRGEREASNDRGRPLSTAS
jgi:hypothetical protein